MAHQRHIIHISKCFNLLKQIHLHLNKVEFKCGFEFAFQMQYTPFKWNCLTHQNLYIKFQPSIMCLSIAFILIATSCFVCRVEVEPEQEAAPFVEDPEIEPRQQGKQTPLIMSIKSHFPLISSLCIV